MSTAWKYYQAWKHKHGRVGVWVIVCTLLLIAAVTTVVVAQPMTDGQLFNTALAEFNNKDYFDAARYLTAYQQRNPATIRTNPAHATQVQNALNHSIERIRDEQSRKEWLEQRVIALSEQCRQAASGPIASSSSGLGVETPTPPPLEGLPRVTDTSYPLVCRGGGNLGFGFALTSSRAAEAHLWVSFERAAQGVGYGWENIAQLNPGQCAWLDRPISSDEPNEIVIRQSDFPLQQVDVSWSHGTLQSATLDYVDALQLEYAYVTFHAYNSRTGFFVVTNIEAPAYVSDVLPLFRVVDIASDKTLRMRVAAGKEYDVVTNIPFNSESVELMGMGVDVDGVWWVPVRYGTWTGWVDSTYLSPLANLGGTGLEFSRTLARQEPTMQGVDVRLLQQVLVDLGYGDLVGTVDGIFGKQTESAVRQFQRDQGLVDDGVVTAELWAKMLVLLAS